MDFSSILTTLWSKISKPLPNILIGSVFLAFAPESMTWFGYIFIAIGVSSVGEWLWQNVVKWLDSIKRKQHIRDTLYVLNHDEKKLLRDRLKSREQTYCINYNDYHFSNLSKGSRREYIQLFGVCEGLTAKGLFVVTASSSEITSWSIHQEVWQIMQKKLFCDPNFLKTGRERDD